MTDALQALEALIQAQGPASASQLAQAIIAAGWKQGVPVKAGEWHFNPRTGAIAHCPNAGCPIGLATPHYASEAAAREALDAAFLARIRAGEKLPARDWTIISNTSASVELLVLVVTTRPFAQWANVMQRLQRLPEGVAEQVGPRTLGRGFDRTHPEAYVQSLMYAGQAFIEAHLSLDEIEALLEASPYFFSFLYPDEATAGRILAYLEAALDTDARDADWIASQLNLLQNCQGFRGAHAQERQRLYWVARDTAEARQSA